METKQNILVLDNGSHLEFQYNIWKFLLIGESIVILFHYPLDANFDNNIWMVNQDGEIIWKIQKLSEYGIGKQYNSPYSGIWSDKNSNVLTAYNTFGYTCIIDIATGKIIEASFTK